MYECFNAKSVGCAVILAACLILFMSMVSTIRNMNVCMGNAGCKCSGCAMASQAQAEPACDEPLVGTREEPDTKVYPDGDEPWDPAMMSLENSVFDSHREFVSDAYVSTQGPNNKDQVRDDTNDINPRVGLRNINYRDVYTLPDARVQSSEEPAQMMSGRTELSW